MKSPEPPSPAPRFRLWIRRQNVTDGPYSVRFEVLDGKGILRVARPGVLVDPPARPLGVEERLSEKQLRMSRFLVVWDGGRARQVHQLSQLPETQLARLEADRWYETEVFIEGGFRHIVLGATVVPSSETSGPRSAVAEVRDGLQQLVASGSAGSPDGVHAFPFSPASLTKSAHHGRGEGVRRSRVGALPDPDEMADDDLELEDEEGLARLSTDEVVPLGDGPDAAEIIDEEEGALAADEAEGEEADPADEAMAAFGDDDAAFAIDTPAMRMQTSHVVLGPVDSVTFFPGAPVARDEMPADVLTLRAAVPTQASQRASIDEKARIAELEARVAELEAALATARRGR